MIWIMLIADGGVGGIGLGTAPFAFGGGTFADPVATVRAALDAGVGLIDTALAYTWADAESYAEHVIATAPRDVADGDRPLIATEGGHWRQGDRFPVDGRPAVLRAHCEISLRTLGVETIDLYYLHVDPVVPLTDSVDALGQLRGEGKITAIGLSNVTIAQLDQALTAPPSSACS